MKTFTISAVNPQPGWDHVVYSDGNGDDRETAIPTGRLETFMAEYGLDDPAAALETLLYGPHVGTLLDEAAPADDPAAVAGWVTTTDPDAEPIDLFTARSTPDAAGAHLTRVEAVKARHAVLNDPDGHLVVLHTRPLNTALLRRHREAVDTARWTNIYGGLPVRGPSRTPLRQARG